MFEYICILTEQQFFCILFICLCSINKCLFKIIQFHLNCNVCTMHHTIYDQGERVCYSLRNQKLCVIWVISTTSDCIIMFCCIMQRKVKIRKSIYENKTWWNCTLFLFLLLWFFFFRIIFFFNLRLKINTYNSSSLSIVYFFLSSSEKEFNIIWWGPHIQHTWYYENLIYSTSCRWVISGMLHANE